LRGSSLESHVRVSPTSIFGSSRNFRAHTRYSIASEQNERRRDRSTYRDASSIDLSRTAVGSNNSDGHPASYDAGRSPSAPRSSYSWRCRSNSSDIASSDIYSNHRAGSSNCSCHLCHRQRRENSEERRASREVVSSWIADNRTSGRIWIASHRGCATKIYELEWEDEAPLLIERCTCPAGSVHQQYENEYRCAGAGQDRFGQRTITFATTARGLQERDLTILPTRSPLSLHLGQTYRRSHSA